MSNKAPVPAFSWVAVAFLFGMPLGVAVAQQEGQPPALEDAPANESAEAPEASAAAEATEIEEIVVISPRPGSRRNLDEDYEDPVKARLLKEFYRMQELDEEYAWRKAGKSGDSSRIKWGYDPRDEYRMRNDTALQDLSWEKTKPAKVFRFEF